MTEHPLKALRRAEALAGTEERKNLKIAAEGIEKAIIEFDPMEDLVGGLRALNAAMSRASRAYADVMKQPLVDAPAFGRRKSDAAGGPPEAA